MITITPELAECINTLVQAHKEWRWAIRQLNDLQAWEADGTIREVIETIWKLKPNQEVVIEVLGGVASIAKCPDGIEVEIIDYDCFEDEEPV